MRLTSFTFGLFYLLSVVGYGLEFHYCLGRITDVNYALFETSCQCDDAHQGRAVGCCEEREFFVQLEEDHNTPPATELGQVHLPLIASWGWGRLELSSGSSVVQTQVVDRGPPVIEDRYLEHCALILYG